MFSPTQALKALSAHVEALFLFAFVWSVGCTVDLQGRRQFDAWLRSETASNTSPWVFPPNGTVSNIYPDRTQECVIGTGVDSSPSDVPQAVVLPSSARRVGKNRAAAFETAREVQSGASVSGKEPLEARPLLCIKICPMDAGEYGYPICYTCQPRDRFNTLIRANRIYLSFGEPLRGVDSFWGGRWPDTPRNKAFGVSRT